MMVDLMIEDEQYFKSAKSESLIRVICARLKQLPGEDLPEAPGLRETFMKIFGC
jgi:hypothetical protein